MLQRFFEDPELQKFFLIFVRLSGLVVFAPPFMNQRLSTQFKGGLVFFLAVAIYPTVGESKVVLPYDFPTIALAILGEMWIGFLIGFSIQLLFMTFQLAGEFVDKHIGFAMASLVDPQTDVTVSILGSLFMNLTIYVFIEMGGHLWIIQSFAGSFLTLPLLESQFNGDGMLYHMSELVIVSFKSAMQFAMPVIVVVTLVYVVQGYLQRTIPQFQIFVVGFIFTITIGLTSVQMILQHFVPVSEDLISFFQQRVWFMISHLNG